jgi:hypothetical protein
MFSFIRSVFIGLKNSNYRDKPMTYTKKETKSATTKSAPATPVKQLVTLEADEESIDLLPQESIRSEVNFLNYPFFALSRKDAQTRTTTEYIDERGDKKFSWVVSANARYGYPRPFDQQVFKAIEHIISEMKRRNPQQAIKNPIRIGSLYRIAKLMNVSDKGRVYKDIKEAILRMKAATIHSKGTFYDKGRKRRVEAAFSLVDQAVFLGEELNNGELADSNYVSFGSPYLESWNAKYTKPLDYTYYRSLHSPISARLYDLLGVKFSGNPFINYRYSKLCQLLPVTRYQYFARVKQQLEPAHQELTSTGFLAKVEWVKVKNDPHDWLVYYWAGERAKKEIELAERQGALPPPDDLQLEQPTIPSRPQQAEEYNDVVVALQNFGISKKTAKRLAKNHSEQDVFEKLQLVQWLVDTKSPLVSKNPQGFLVKALDEGYLPQPPQGYKTATQKKEEAERQQQELEQQQQAAEQFKKAREEARQKLIEKHPPQPIEGTGHTTQSAWSKALESLQEQVSPAVFNGWLKDTLLLQVTDTAARIAAPSRLACTQLEYRLYREISNAMKGILGKDLDLEFVVASPE